MQQGPHTKPCLFTPLIVTFPLSFLPARCCCEWPAMLLLLSFSGSSSTLSAEAWISRSPSSPTSSSSSSPGGRENRTALTRWTSTKGRSNWNYRSFVFLIDLTFSLEFMFLNVFWCYLILCVCVPVKVCEKAQRVCFSHQDEVCRPVGQVADGERPFGLRGHELEIQVREIHLNLPSTVTHSPEIKTIIKGSRS